VVHRPRIHPPLREE